jgi:hypothetical protein
MLGIGTSLVMIADSRLSRFLHVVSTLKVNPSRNLNGGWKPAYLTSVFSLRTSVSRSFMRRQTDVNADVRDVRWVGFHTHKLKEQGPFIVECQREKNKLKAFKPKSIVDLTSGPFTGFNVSPG